MLLLMFVINVSQELQELTIVLLQMRSRVVVVKYDRKPLSNKTLFAFTEPFGRLREHLVLNNKVGSGSGACPRLGLVSVQENCCL